MTQFMPEVTGAQRVAQLRQTNPEQFERVRLVGNDNQYFVFDPPGTIVSAYGHDWTVMPGQVLEMDMHRDFIPSEIAAGRIIRVKPRDPEQEQRQAAEVEEMKKDPRMRAGVDPSEVDEDGFSMDSETVFGAGSIDLLRVRLDKLKPKRKICDFIAKRYNIKLSDRMLQNELLQEAIQIVETALGK